MKKELNILQASNMPKCTKFRIIYSDGTEEKYDVFFNSLGIVPCINNTTEVMYATKNLLNAKFIPILTPVYFMDLVKDTQGKKVYVEFDTNCKQYSNVFIPKESNYFREYLFNIINNNNDYDVGKIISEGKWYIEY